MSEIAAQETASQDISPETDASVVSEVQNTFDRAIDELNGLPGAGQDAPSRNDVTQASTISTSSDLIWNIDVDVRVVLGSAKLSVAHLMAMEPGEVINVNRQVGEPLDIVVNGKNIARGEITMMENDESQFGIRITELLKD